MTASQLTARIVDGRGREEASWRVARQEIADGDSTVGEEAVTVGDAAHDLARIGRTVRDEEPLAVLLPPPERGDPIVVSVEDPGLARRGLRRQKRLPRIEGHRSGADPSRESRHPPGFELPHEDGMGEPIDLDEDDARAVRPFDTPVTHDELANERPEE